MGKENRAEGHKGRCQPVPVRFAPAEHRRHQPRAVRIFCPSWAGLSSEMILKC